MDNAVTDNQMFLESNLLAKSHLLHFLNCFSQDPRAKMAQVLKHLVGQRFTPDGFLSDLQAWLLVPSL